MTIGTVTPRKTGATATLARLGHPVVTSAAGGKITVVTRPSESGFSPLDLIYASLAACLVLSARIAASEQGVLGRLRNVEARVHGSKAAEGASRVERFDIEMLVDADLDEAAKDAIVAAAERICTISNTLHGGASVEIHRAGN
ncbi:OsmC family protein [Labrys okinawensis]|uniref:OsmC family protein n=1 Tax=Labrys okinawensis TaxID=346911 RepID=UPI0039BD49B2